MPAAGLLAVSADYRLNRVMATQFVRPYLTEVILGFENAKAHLDQFAVAPYFGGVIDKVDLVIDHHPEQAGYSAVFKDIRPDYGAAATMVTEYLRVGDEVTFEFDNAGTHRAGEFLSYVNTSAVTRTFEVVIGRWEGVAVADGARVGVGLAATDGSGVTTTVGRVERCGGGSRNVPTRLTSRSNRSPTPSTLTRTAPKPVAK